MISSTQMEMLFDIDHILFAQARAKLSRRGPLYWIVGGAGSGKTTVCQILSKKTGFPIYDMDAHIYGTYHSRFTQERHPVNKAWSMAPNALAWLLGMSWDEFDRFNQAAFPEYLDLLAEDLAEVKPSNGWWVDGGISSPALLAQVIPAHQMVCLALEDPSSARIWGATGDRRAMKEAIHQLPHPDAMRRKFLEFDRRLTQVILKECWENGIKMCLRDKNTSGEELAQQVAALFGM